MRLSSIVIASTLVACSSTDPRLPRQALPSDAVAAVRSVPSDVPPSPDSPPSNAPPVAIRTCAETLLADLGIDVSPEPRVCEPLLRVISTLGPTALTEIRDLVIVRGARGPCGDQCPDLATALMSDAALAFYRIATHELHVLDAAFEGPRWRSPLPSPAAVADYLAALGLPDWPALITRVNLVTGLVLPTDLPPGAPAVLDAIVVHGPRLLLGREVDLEGIIRHELGHTVQLRNDVTTGAVAEWATLSGWTEPADAEPADGYVKGVFASERPIVASRLVLALPRGAPTFYVPTHDTFATGYAAFDPMEDYAEALRLLRDDPTRLGEAAPAKLLTLVATTMHGLPDTAIAIALAPHRRFIEPGVRALLAPHVDAFLTARVLRTLGPSILPEATPLADATPLVHSPDLPPSVAAELATLVVDLGTATFRPTDAAVAVSARELEAHWHSMQELQKLIDSPE
jgi:hypothetical protein